MIARWVSAEVIPAGAVEELLQHLRPLRQLGLLLLLHSKGQVQHHAKDLGVDAPSLLIEVLLLREL